MQRWVALAGFLFFVTLFASCSFYDFFSYREDTGLFVIEPPTKYGNIKFGMELAPTQTPTMDLVGISAGRNTPTLFYRLGQEGHLVDIGDRWDDYLLGASNEDALKDSGSGAALAGLPVWIDRTGCVAIGEPDFRRVYFKCENQDSLEFPWDQPDFGKKLVAIEPTGDELSMLAVAGRDRAWVMAHFNGPGYAPTLSDAFWPVDQPGEVQALAAGHLGSHLYVALTTSETKDEPGRVSVFMPTETDPRVMEEVACLEKPGEAAFGNSLATGDVLGDLNDELIVSAGRVTDPDNIARKNAVYIYDIGALLSERSPSAESGGMCPEIPVQPSFELTPSPGERDVECEEDCLFGLTLTVGDIATDDQYPELIVGAPGARAKGKRQGGAVYIYRRNEAQTEPLSLAGQVIDSSPETGMEFGGGLAVAPMGGRNELLIGATGKGKVFVAFCTGVGQNVDVGGDVTTDASGAVVSTRCRP